MSRLFSEFSPSVKSEWLAKVEKDLRGRSIDDLDWQVNQSIAVSPFAHQEDLKTSYAPIIGDRPANHWEVGLKISTINWASANREALEGLNNGANALCFIILGDVPPEELSILLKGIQLEWVSTHFMVPQRIGIGLLNSFVNYLRGSHFDPNKIACSFNFNGSPFPGEKDIDSLKEMFGLLPNAKLTVNGIPFQKGKEQIVFELANILHLGHLQLMHLCEQKTDLEEWSERLQFSISLNDSYFLNIAKVRALKLLWEQMLLAWELQQVPDIPIAVHLTSATHSEDENYNKIKATAQAMAAVVGGANQLFIYPSDESGDNTGTPFAQRIALNIQHLMQLESYMDRVIDPAAGSYYVEQLTDKLAEAAWNEFATLVEKNS